MQKRIVKSRKEIKKLWSKYLLHYREGRLKADELKYFTHLNIIFGNLKSAGLWKKKDDSREENLRRKSK